MVKLLVCISILLVLLVRSDSSSAGPCCTEYHNNPIATKFIRYYKWQNGTDYCNIKAVIFKLRRGRLACANPEDEWVKQTLETVPHRP